MNKKTRDERDLQINDNQKKKNAKKEGEHIIKINPDDRANENIPEEKRQRLPGKTGGVGSEITDGEDG